MGRERQHNQRQHWVTMGRERQHSQREVAWRFILLHSMFSGATRKHVGLDVSHHTLVVRMHLPDNYVYTRKSKMSSKICSTHDPTLKNLDFSNMCPLLLCNHLITDFKIIEAFQWIPLSKIIIEFNRQFLYGWNYYYLMVSEWQSLDNTSNKRARHASGLACAGINTRQKLVQ